MKIWRIEAAEPAHITAIAAGMREADIREVWASDRWRPKEALEKSLLYSAQAWTCLIEDAPAFMWGVSRKGSVFSETGVPWLLGTDAIYRVSREFLKQSRSYIEKMHEHCPYLENHVHAGNKLSIRWLKWCGFTIESVPVFINQEAFFRFWRKSQCVA